MIDVRDLEKHFGALRAVDGVTFEIRAGEAFGLLGPNGAGKTTLVHHLLGLQSPVAGHVAVAGEPYTEDNARALRRGIGLVFQDADDQLFMPTVLEDVAFGPANLGLAGDELTRVFDRSYQAPARTGDRTVCGLGLGLFLCRELVRLHGGEIWAENREGAGARFTVTVEACPDPSR